uniref:UBX domain-containing protein 7-like n=1 Tax=Styela clava TaxID=7725 RepID=UPI0019397294|nr:UBX domain-containing protein 7-like [Styela clava]
MGSREKLIKEFVSITGTDKGTAEHFLDACSDNLETAVAMFLDDKTPGTTENTDTSAPAIPVEEEIRAPIPQTSGVLVDDPHYITTSRERCFSRRRPRSVFDGFRDFKAEISQQEALFSSDPTTNRRLKRLEDLFRPPLELMHKGTLETAREAGSHLHKWLMVNVQNNQEFACQVLNRDVWSRTNVQTLIKKHFIFWQVYSDSTEGERFTTFYPVTRWPHVSILDPRTGEQLAVWNDINSNNIEGKVEEFLADHGSIADDVDSGPPNKKVKRDHSVVDDTEDKQLAAAIAASLAENKAPATTQSDSDIDNNDDFLISNESSDNVSEFDASSDEDISDIQKGATKGSKTAKKCNENGKISIEDTEIDDEYFSIKNGEKTTSESKKFSENGAKNYKNREESNDLSTNTETSKISKQKTYKKVNSRLKVGSIENGKDLSKLTNDIYGCETSNTSKIPQNTNNAAEKSQSKDDKTNNSEDKLNEMCRIMVRFPDGSREEIKLASDLTVKDLSSELRTRGYPPEDYDVVTHFPRKSIFSSGEECSLKEAGLFPRAAVFVQEIDS